MAINKVVLLGKISEAGPKVTYNDKGRPECRLTVLIEDRGRDGQTFTTFIPVFVYGPGAEACAEGCDAGDVVVIDGKLAWKSTPKKDGTKLGLCVTCFGVEVVTKATPAVEVPA